MEVNAIGYIDLQVIQLKITVSLGFRHSQSHKRPMKCVCVCLGTGVWQAGADHCDRPLQSKQGVLLKPIIRTAMSNDRSGNEKSPLSPSLYHTAACDCQSGSV